MLPHQPDDLLNGYITLFSQESIERAKEIYFPDEPVSAYHVSLQKLDQAGYVTMRMDEHSFMLIGPGEDQMKPIPVSTLRQKMW